jgi:hypothetical protein
MSTSASKAFPNQFMHRIIVLKLRTVYTRTSTTAGSSVLVPSPAAGFGIPFQTTHHQPSLHHPATIYGISWKIYLSK